MNIDIQGDAPSMKEIDAARAASQRKVRVTKIVWSVAAVAVRAASISCYLAGWLSTSTAIAMAAPVAVVGVMSGVFVGPAFWGCALRCAVGIWLLLGRVSERA